MKLPVPKCAVDARKEECGADGEMKGDEDGLTGPEEKMAQKQNKTKISQI